MTLYDELRVCATPLKGDLADVRSKRTRDDQLNACATITQSLLSDSTICTMGDGIYYFNGQIYEQVPKQEYNICLYNILCEFKVPPVVAKQIPSFTLAYIWDKKKATNHDLIAFKNGIYSLTSRSLHAFSPEFNCTYKVDFPYDSSASCPLWEQFIRQVLPDAAERARLQEFVGMVYIDRERIKIEKALILIGEGANGKSVVYNVIRALVGSDYIASLSPRQLQDDRLLVGLAGKKINYCSEVRASDTMTSALKSLISSEPTAAWGLYKGLQYVTCPPIIFTMNRYPDISDRSHGFFRRMLPIRFDITIPPNEQDKELAYKIISQELCGIFNWAMAGRDRLLSQKGEFTDSPTLQQEIVRMEDESSQILEYMQDNGYDCKPQYRGQKAIRIRASELFKGMSRQEIRTAAQQLSNKGYRRIKCGTICYLVYLKN